MTSSNGGWHWRFDWRTLVLDYTPIWPVLPKVRCPSLVVRGENSIVMPQADYERAVRELPGSKGVVLAGAHHHVPLDTPKELADVLRTFVEED